MTRLATALAAATWLSTARALSPNLMFDLFLTDQSPLLQFQESESEPAQWDILFSNNSAPAVGDVGLGTSLHRQTIDEYYGYSYKLSFETVSVGVRVEGTIRTSDTRGLNWNFGDGIIGEDIGAPPGPILVDTALETLNFTQHRGALSFLSSKSVFTVSNVTVRTGMQTEAQSLVEVPTSFIPFVTDSNEANTYFSYQGKWEVLTTIGNEALPHRSLKGAPGSALRAPVPPHTAFVVLNGTAGPDYGALYVEFEGVQPPISPSFMSYSSTLPVSNSSKALISTAQAMYYVPLDPAITNYSMIIKAPKAGFSSIGLHSITFYSGLLSTAGTEFTTKSAEEWPGGRADDITNPPSAWVAVPEENLAPPRLTGKPGDAGVSHTVTGGYTRPSGTGQSATGTSRPTTSSSSTPGSGAADKRKTPVGAIVGGIVGGITGILLLVALFLLYRRRKNKASREPFNIDDNQSDEEEEEHVVTPLKGTPGASAGERYTNATGSGYDPALMRASQPDEPEMFDSSQAPATGAVATSRPRRQPRILPLPPKPPPPRARTPQTHERDAGALLPPMYTDIVQNR